MTRITFISYLILALHFCAANGEAIAQETKEQDESIIIVRVFETANPLHKSKIIIVDGDKILNNLELKRQLPKNMGENARRIALILASVEKEGYEMIDVSSSGGSWYSVKDYLFKKP